MKLIIISVIISVTISYIINQIRNKVIVSMLLDSIHEEQSIFLEALKHLIKKIN